MTNQELNIELAKFAGLKNPRLVHWCGYSELMPAYDCTAQQESHGVTTQLCPDYCNNLNAIHLLEARIPFDKEEEYGKLLTKIIQRDKNGIRQVWHASAKQRAEALISMFNHGH